MKEYNIRIRIINKEDFNPHFVNKASKSYFNSLYNIMSTKPTTTTN
jgi:hypothetical protein